MILKLGILIQLFIQPHAEAALHRYLYEKELWKYAANLQEKTHAEVRFQKSFTLQHGCSPVNLLRIFGTPFPKNASGGLLLLFKLLIILKVHTYMSSNWYSD